MIRFLYRLFDREYEPCKGCEVLKTQLEIANRERAELLQTMISLVKPEVIQHPVKAVSPIINKSVPWAIRKKQLEENDREQLRILREQESIIKKLVPQEEIDNLEKELGVEDAGENSLSKTV